MADDMIHIEVDGQLLEAKPGQMLIEVTDAAGITVPRFCYHKHLSVAANCRMCLVEVEKAPKPLPACATPCVAGMKVFTRSPLAREAQKGTMEFLLINHPLDCPICDQGGECELQDVAMGYGGDVSRFTERKRVVPDPDIGPLVATDMTRCIHCTRCVRFGEEIAGLRELGATGRGEHTRIGTYIKHAMRSELSGNVIDLCPVGALTSKPFRFTARAWEMTQHASIAPHDGVGSNLFMHVRRGEVMRVVPCENPAINETWISDRDRYSYAGLSHPDRLTQPLLRDEKNQWREASWEEALKQAAQALQEASGAVMGRISPQATVEEMFLLQKLVRALGSEDIDHRLRQQDFRADAHSAAIPWLGATLQDLEKADAVLLIGTNLRQEQPLINHRVRKAALSGAQVMNLGSSAYAPNMPIASAQAVKPSALLDVMDAVLAALENTAENHAIATPLKQASKAFILIGNQLVAHPDYALLLERAVRIADAAKAQLGLLPEAGNSLGAWLVGAVPHRAANSAASSASAASARCALLFGLEPDADTALASEWMQQLKSMDAVIACSAYRSPALLDVAKVILPIVPFTETAGTYVNAQGDWQSVRAVTKPRGDARPGWKVLRVLGNFLGLADFDYDSAEAVCTTLRDKQAHALRPMPIFSVSDQSRRLTASELEAAPFVLPYAIDAIVRRSAPLQAAEKTALVLRMHPATATRHQYAQGTVATLQIGQQVIVAPVEYDDAVALDTVLYPATAGRDMLWGAAAFTRSQEALFA